MKKVFVLSSHPLLMTERKIFHSFSSHSFANNFWGLLTIINHLFNFLFKKYFVFYSTRCYLEERLSIQRMRRNIKTITKPTSLCHKRVCGEEKPKKKIPKENFFPYFMDNHNINLNIMTCVMAVSNISSLFYQKPKEEKMKMKIISQKFMKISAEWNKNSPRLRRW